MYKVLMVESSNIYADGRVLKEAASLTDGGYHVQVCGFRERIRVKKTYAFRIFAISIWGKKNRFLRNLSIVYAIILLNIRALFIRSDVFHAHNTYFLVSGYLHKKIYKSKLVYDAHEVQSDMGWLPSRLEAFFIKRVDFIINVNSGRRGLMIEKYGLKVPIGLIHNYPVPIADTSNKTGHDKEITFVFSGGFDLDDNPIDNFIKAMRDFRNIRFVLYSFGYRDSMERLKETVISEGMEGRVIFCDLVPPEELTETISQFSAAVNFLTNPQDLPSYNYHAINKMYDYLHAGLPILCSTMSTFYEEFEKTGMGICVDVYDLESIKDGIRKIVKLLETAQLKELIRANARANYSWSSEEIVLKEIYKELCAE